MGLLDNIITVESGGNANARNPNSSAAGLGQFIDSTWLNMISRYRPDITGSREELLALKMNPELSKEMLANYAAENGKVLQNAGFDSSPGNTYLAHFAGPAGALKVLQADPNAPVEAILGGAAVKANPFLAGMTAASLKAWADKKMGGAGAVQTNQIASVARQPTTISDQQTNQRGGLLSAPADNAMGLLSGAAPQAQSALTQSYEPQLMADLQSDIAVPPLIQSMAGPNRQAQRTRLSQLKATIQKRPFSFGNIA